MGLLVRTGFWISGATLAAFGGLVLISGPVLCERALHASRCAVEQASPPGETAIIQARDGTRLEAWFLRPARPNGDCAMLAHGIADSRASGLRLAPMFLERGYAVLLPDSRAQGESGGDMVTYGLLERWDVLEWAGWMRGAGCRELFGLGESMGAAILLQAEAERPVFRAIVAECPFASLRWVAEERVMGRLRGPAPLRRMLAGLVVRSAFVYARLRYGLDFNQAAPVRNVLRLRTPVLLIEGSRDTNIPLRHARAIASCGRSVTLWLVPDAGHTGAAGTDPKGFRRRVIDWFEKQASAPAR